MNKLFRIIMSIMLMMLAGMSVAEAASYTVKRGDTLSAIAVAQKTTVKALVALNPKITNPDRIYVGQVITTSAETGATANEPAQTPAVKSIVRKTSARVTTKTSTTAAMLPTSSCDTQTAIAKSGFPVHVADLLREATKDERYNEFVVTTTDTRYTFSYTENCVFSGKERAIPQHDKPVSVAARHTGTTPINRPSIPLADIWARANDSTDRAEGDFLWKKPGANKCVECDMDRFLNEEYPKDVAHALRKEVESGNADMINIKKGDRFDDMLFGRNKKVKQVVAAWTDSHEEPAQAYAVQKNGRLYFLVLPDICGNWAKREINAHEYARQPLVSTPESEGVCKTCPELRPSYVFPALPQGTPVKDEAMVKFYGAYASQSTTTTPEVSMVAPNPYSAFGSGIDP